jgi:two-component system nitrate/nitrite response regulator NarL
MENVSPVAASAERVLVRVAVVDDHPMVVDGLVAGLRSSDRVDVVAIAGTTSAAAELLEREDIDVVLLDVRLEDDNGLEVLARRSRRPKPYVLVLSSFNARQYVAVAARLGASGYLLKTAPLPQLLDAISAIAGGGNVLSEAQLGTQPVLLSPRERDVIALTMRGLTNKEIADKLGTSKKAVEQHLTEVFTREQIAGGRVELALRAASEGWLDIDAAPTRRDRQRKD